METSVRDGILPPMVVTPFSVTSGPPASGTTGDLHLPRARADFGPAAPDTQDFALLGCNNNSDSVKPLDTAATAPGTAHSAGKLVENVHSHYFLADPPQLVLQGQLGRVPVPGGGGDPGSCGL